MESEDDASESMQERVPGSALKLWVLLEASRLSIAGVVLAGIFLGLAAVVLLDPAAFERAVRRGDPVQTLFQALVTAIVTGVTLVVSINSLVLSQELGPVGQKREEMDQSTGFREDVADVLDTPVSPADPAAFLGAMLSATGDRARALRAAVTNEADSGARSALADYADQVERATERTTEELAGAEFGTFDVVSASLDFDYSLLLYEGKRLAGVHGGTIEEGTHDRLDDVLTVLHRFGPAREHVKTLYFQWELVDLSRAMLYAAVPALVVSIGGILVLGGVDAVPGTTVGVSNLAWVVIAGATVALSPFAILLAYILRVATVAKRTLAIGPFVLRGEKNTGGSGDGD